MADRRPLSRAPAVAAAAILLALAALCSPAGAAAPAHAAEPMLRVTVFDDRVVDGVFSGSTPNRAGAVDVKRTAGFAYLRDGAGEWWAGSADAAGDFVFPSAAPGPATLYFAVDGPAASSAARDAATGAILAQRTDIGFDAGTYVDPGGASSPVSLVPGERFAEAAVHLGAGATAAFALTALQATAVVELERSGGLPAPELATVELLSNGAGVPTSVDGAGTYRTPAEWFFTASSMGVRVTPAPGYRIVEITASIPNGKLSVRRQGSDATISTIELPFSTGLVAFRIVVAAGETATPTPSASSTSTAAAAGVNATPDDAATATATPAGSDDGWRPALAIAAGVLLAGAAAWLVVRRRAAARRRREEEAALAALPDVTRFAPEG